MYTVMDINDHTIHTRHIEQLHIVHPLPLVPNNSDNGPEILTDMQIIPISPRFTQSVSEETDMKNTTLNDNENIEPTNMLNTEQVQPIIPENVPQPVALRRSNRIKK